MENTTTEVSTQQRIATHLDQSLKMAKAVLAEGLLKDDWEGYYALFNDGRELLLHPDEMSDLTKTSEVNDLLLTVHTWLYREGECVFACVEIASQKGIVGNLLSLINPEEGERDGWIRPEQAGGAIEEYFKTRNTSIHSHMKESYEEEKSREQWLGVSKATAYGAN